ncbi:hypothetical protein [Candidatus Nanohalococcus occultus]|uniref:hypothetical protein n=1 Tax=Candidatus Nanohalococcus occultus TaxID=2978047 RepID=UPI0039DF593B
MSKDYREILSGKVEEVKERIEDLESPDFEKLLKLEREGKDRKTVKEFIESLKDTEEEEAEPADESEGSDEAKEVSEPSVPQEGFREKLGRLSPASLVGLGLVIGIVAGAGAAQLVASGSGTQSPSAVKSDMQSLLSGPNRTVDVGPAMREHGMYYFNVSTSQQTVNGTQTSYREFYVSNDGELLFPKLEVPLLGLRTPVNLQDALSQRAATQANATR